MSLLRTTPEIILALESDKYNIICGESKEIKTILVQTITREIEGNTLEFWALKNLVVHEPFQRQGIFKQIIVSMERSGRNVMAYNIINPLVEDYLESLGYIGIRVLEHQELITSYYKLFG